MKRRQCFVSNSSSSSYTIDDPEDSKDEDRFLICHYDASDKILYLLRKIDEVSNMLSFGSCEEGHLTRTALDAAYSILQVEQTRLVKEAAATREMVDTQSFVPAEISCPHCEVERLWDVAERFATLTTYPPFAMLVSASCAAAPLYKCARCGTLWQCFPERGLVEIDL